MTKAPPSKIVTKPLVDGFAKVQVLNEEAARIKRIAPVPTVWGRADGLPIYNRLPGISQGFQLEYFGEKDNGLVYVDPQFGTTRGPGSLEVGAWTEDQHILLFESGTITWQHGQIQTDTLAIDLRTIVDGGVQDGVYQAGYYIDYARPEDPPDGVFDVENYSLGGSASLYEANRTAPYRPVSAMFSSFEDGSWSPTEYAVAGKYPDASYVDIDFTVPVVAREFKLSVAEPLLGTAKCALYSSIDAIVWHIEDSREPEDLGWTVRGNSDGGRRYWKLFFWDGTAEVTSVLYTGQAVYPNQRPVGSVTIVQPFLEGKFDQLEPRPYIVLATLEVKEQAVVETTDERNFTSVKYEPVAKWLTDFQDNSLRELFTSIEKYSAEYMSPVTGAVKLYDDLLDRGNFKFGSDTEAPTFDQPVAIELRPPTQIVGDADLLSDPLRDNVATDPAGFLVLAENIVSIVQTSTVTPQQVINLGAPVEQSDLSTKAYVDITFTTALDDGFF